MTEDRPQADEWAEAGTPPSGEDRYNLRGGLLVRDAEPEGVVRERSEYLQRIYALIRMRWYAVIALLITLTLTMQLGNFSFSKIPPWLVLIGMAFYNILFEIDFQWRERRKIGMQGLGSVYRSANAQIDLDLVALTVLIHFTGGIDSPFVFFYIFQTITASFLLSRRETFLQAFLAIALFASLCFMEAEPEYIESLDITLVEHVYLYGEPSILTVPGVDEPSADFENLQYILAYLLALSATLFVSGGIGTYLAERYREKEQAIHELAITDGLTGLYNYRYFSEQIELEFERARRYRHSLALLMVDLDGLKNFNDAHGHLLGSQALKEIAEILKGTSRTIDVVAKYGGDEFALVLPETDKKGATFIGERVRQRVRDHKYVQANRKREGRLTVSVGVAVFPDDATALRELVEVADNCLYEAKQAGRNRVRIAGVEGFLGGETDGRGRPDEIAGRTASVART